MGYSGSGDTIEVEGNNTQWKSTFEKVNWEFFVTSHLRYFKRSKSGRFFRNR